MKLDKQKNKESGFKIPDNYFEEFRLNIPDLIKKKKTISKTNHKTLVYAVAASIVLLMVSTITFLPELTRSNIQSDNYELSDAEYYEINMEDLYYAFNDDTESINTSSDLDNETINYMADDMDLEEIIVLSEK